MNGAKDESAALVDPRRTSASEGQRGTRRHPQMLGAFLRVGAAAESCSHPAAQAAAPH